MESQIYSSSNFIKFLELTLALRTAKTVLIAAGLKRREHIQMKDHGQCFKILALGLWILWPHAPDTCK